MINPGKHKTITNRRKVGAKMIKNKNTKVFNVTYTTTSKDDETDAIIILSSHIEKEVEKIVYQLYGEGHQVGCNYDTLHNQVYIIVDEGIKLKAKMTNYEHVCTESLVDMEKLMRDYDISSEELQNMYKFDETLKNDIEIYNRKYTCKVTISIADSDIGALEKARKILESIIFEKTSSKTN